MRERFWSILHDELQRTRLGIAPGCEDHFENLIRDMAMRIHGDGWRRPQIDVEDDFRRLVREAARLAGQRGYQELHEDTFHDGKQIFGCPGFWPFC